MAEQFVAGDIVLKRYHGLGDYVEEYIKAVAKVEDGVVYLASGEVGDDGELPDLEDYETGITYDAETGMELEQFFMPMHSTIVPLV